MSLPGNLYPLTDIEPVAMAGRKHLVSWEDDALNRIIPVNVGEGQNSTVSCWHSVRSMFRSLSRVLRLTMIIKQPPIATKEISANHGCAPLAPTPVESSRYTKEIYPVPMTSDINPLSPISARSPTPYRIGSATDIASSSIRPRMRRDSLVAPYAS